MVAALLRLFYAYVLVLVRLVVSLLSIVVFVVAYVVCFLLFFFFFFQAEDGIRDRDVTGVQTCALPISRCSRQRSAPCGPHGPAASSRFSAQSADTGS